MIHEKGKRITDITQFKKGKKYIAAGEKVFEFSHIGRNGNPYFIDDGQGFFPEESENNCVGFNSVNNFYEILGEKYESTEWAIGQEYEFSDDGVDWYQRKLIAVLPEYCENRFIVSSFLSAKKWYYYMQIRHINQPNPTSLHERLKQLQEEAEAHGMKLVATLENK